jgi:hypothetical protein
VFSSPLVLSPAGASPEDPSIRILQNQPRNSRGRSVFSQSEQGTPSKRNLILLHEIARSTKVKGGSATHYFNISVTRYTPPRAISQSFSSNRAGSPVFCTSCIPSANSQMFIDNRKYRKTEALEVSITCHPSCLLPNPSLPNLGPRSSAAATPLSP